MKKRTYKPRRIKNRPTQVKTERPKKMRVFYNLAVFGKEEKDAVAEVLENFMIVGGSKTREFQEKVAALFAKKYGLLVNSGSSANLTAVELLPIAAGSEVITPALTFGTTVAPLYQKGLIPAYVDVEPGTYQIDVNKVESAITKNTRAMMIPSLIGNIPDYPRLREIADKYKLWLIEDSCDTLGATIGGKPTGFYSDISTTSFYAAHVITTAGHGGMVCFNRDEWLDRAKTLISWGRSSARNETENINFRFNIEVDTIPYDAKFVFEELGYNFQSTEIDAAFGLAQLKKFRDYFDRRKKNFAELLKFFKPFEKFFILPIQNPRADTCWLAFPLLIRDEAPFTRRDLAVYLEENGIQTRPLFTGNILRQPAFGDLKSRISQKGYPVSDLVMRGSLVIGCHQGLTKEQMAYMQDKFTEFLSRY